MPSDRLRHVYNSAAWKRVRVLVIDRAGGRCQRMTWDEHDREWVRCSVMDKRYGGRASLTVDHTSPMADPLDDQYLVALCRHHHGKKDGARGAQARRQW